MLTLNDGRVIKSQLLKAINIACHYHYFQVRHDSGMPYIFHPLEVCKVGSDAGITDENVLCALVLHDTLEDTTLTESEIEYYFDKKVLSIVKELTKVGIDDGTIDDKIEFLKSFFTKSTEALLCKIADRWCNVKDYKNGKRAWYPAYYALQAWPIEMEFYKRFDAIRTVLGFKVAEGFMKLVSEIRQTYTEQYGELDLTQDADKISELLKTRSKGNKA